MAIGMGADSTAGRFALGVIILGAGASTRMGRPKLLLPWGETSVIGHEISQWQALRAAQIAIVCAHGDGRLAAELDRLGFPAAARIVNPRPERGMFSSVLCAANWDGWQADLTHWAVTLGDQPHLRPETLRALLVFQREHADAICQPTYAGHARHPVLLPRSAWAELRGSTGPTFREFLYHASGRKAAFPVEDPGLALDLDRPEDYEVAVQKFSQGT